LPARRKRHAPSVTNIMRIRDYYSTKSPVFSLEFFPPKDGKSLEDVKQQILELIQLSPDFVTVTYGAGGGTRAFSEELVRFIREKTTVTVCPHLTCVGHSKEELLSLAKSFQESGIENILALRGDPPAGSEHFEPHPEGFTCARDFTKYLKEQTQLCVLTAGYPESHKEARSKAADLDYLKEKVDSGAEVIVTQLFFDEEVYFKFAEDLRARGILVPIVPGIMPISNFQQLERFTKMCGATIPDRIRSEVSNLTGDALVSWGIDEAVRLSTALLKGGAPGIHLYTLNKSLQAKPIMERLSDLLKSAIG